MPRKVLIGVHLLLDFLIKPIKRKEKPEKFWSLLKSSDFRNNYGCYITDKGLEIIIIGTQNYISPDKLRRYLLEYVQIVETNRETCDLARMIQDRREIEDNFSALEIACTSLFPFYFDALVTERKEILRYANDANDATIMTVEKFIEKFAPEVQNTINSHLSLTDLFRRYLTISFKKSADRDIIENETQREEQLNFIKSPPFIFTSNIGERRKAKNYDLTNLATGIGLRPDKLEAWEKGKRSELASILKMLELARVLECQFNELMDVRPDLNDSVDPNFHVYIYNIRSIRNKQQLSIEDVANRLGIRPEKIKAWEEGEGDEIEDLKHFFELAMNLECQPNELISIQDQAEMQTEDREDIIEEQVETHPPSPTTEESDFSDGEEDERIT